MADSKKLSRGELQDLVAKQAVKNPKYRAQLIKDPKMVLSKQLGQELPANLKVKAVEETADTYYVVIPHVPKEGAELGDADLEKVAGGLGDKEATCILSVGSTFIQLNF